jgi:hypothetical protein
MLNELYSTGALTRRTSSALEIFDEEQNTNLQGEFRFGGSRISRMRPQGITRQKLLVVPVERRAFHFQYSTAAA